jgi:hypothetical protein
MSGDWVEYWPHPHEQERLRNYPEYSDQQRPIAWNDVA